MTYSILWSLQKKECSLTGLPGTNTNQAHNACAHSNKDHIDSILDIQKLAVSEKKNMKNVAVKLM